MSLISFTVKKSHWSPLFLSLFWHLSMAHTFFPFSVYRYLGDLLWSGRQCEKKRGNDWISRNWNETLTTETKQNNGRLSLSLLSDRLEVFVHSLPRDFSVPCLWHWRCATTRNSGIKLDNRVFWHRDVHLEATSSAYCSSSTGNFWYLT